MVLIKLGEKEYELKLNYKSIKWLEEKTGDGLGVLFQNLFGETGENFSMEGLELFLTAALRGPKEQRHLDTDAVSDLLEEADELEELNIEEIGEKIKQAVAESSFLKNTNKQKEKADLTATAEKAAKARRARKDKVK